MSILLTGANGYIGSQLTWFLKSIGEEVVTLDLEDYNLKEISSKLYKGDIRDAELLRRIFQELDIEIVVHLAALKSVPESILFPEKYMNVNQAGTIQLAEMSRLMKVKLFINISSAAVYGTAGAGAVSEITETTPDSPYGVSKLQAEEGLAMLVQDFEFRLTNLRLFNVVGQCNLSLDTKEDNNLIQLFVHKMLAGENPNIFGNDYRTPDGTCIRDYVHVGDVLRAIKLCIDQFRQTGEIEDTFNIGSGQGASVLDIYRQLCEVLNLPYRPVFGPRREGDIEAIIANISKAKRSLGYIPQFTIEQAINSSVVAASNSMN
jgi:UDP-glucose 4-epimerase